MLISAFTVSSPSPVDIRAGCDHLVYGICPDDVFELTVADVINKASVPDGTAIYQPSGTLVSEQRLKSYVSVFVQYRMLLLPSLSFSLTLLTLSL